MSECEGMNLELDIDDERYEQLRSRAGRHGFESPEQYATVIIETVVTELEGPEDADENVRDRLDDLGYL